MFKKKSLAIVFVACSTLSLLVGSGINTQVEASASVLQPAQTVTIPAAKSMKTVKLKYKKNFENTSHAVTLIKDSGNYMWWELAPGEAKKDVTIEYLENDTALSVAKRICSKAGYEIPKKNGAFVKDINWHNISYKDTGSINYALSGYTSWNRPESDPDNKRENIKLCDGTSNSEYDGISAG